MDSQLPGTGGGREGEPSAKTLRDAARLTEQFTALCALAQESVGEPEYRYWKKYVQWRKSGRSRSSPYQHWRTVGDGDPITKEEYDVQITEAKKKGTSAFFGELKASYWDYGRTLTKDGWREVLEKMIKGAPESGPPLPKPSEAEGPNPSPRNPPVTPLQAEGDER